MITGCSIEAFLDLISQNGWQILKYFKLDMRHYSPLLVMFKCVDMRSKLQSLFRDGHI